MYRIHSAASTCRTSGYWYAQSHPAEDFAESFAVWLRPGSRWRTEYHGWPAIRKLEYVDDLMAALRDEKPKVTNRSRPDSLAKLRMTLREYYEKKRAFYRVGDDEPEFDRHLDQLFGEDIGSRRNNSRPTAFQFLRQHRTEMRQIVARQTGAYRYVVDQAIHLLEIRCKQRRLRLVRPAQRTLNELSVVLTILTMGFMRGTQKPFSR